MNQMEEEEMATLKTFFLDRTKNFVECEIVKETNHKRQIKVLEGVKKGKTISVHPEGAVWGKHWDPVFTPWQKNRKNSLTSGRATCFDEAW